MIETWQVQKLWAEMNSELSWGAGVTFVDMRRLRTGGIFTIDFGQRDYIVRS